METFDDFLRCSRRVFSLPQISERSESMTESKLLTNSSSILMQSSRSAENFFETSQKKFSIYAKDATFDKKLNIDEKTGESTHKILFNLRNLNSEIEFRYIELSLL